MHGESTAGVNTVGVLIEAIHDRNNQTSSWSDDRDAESRRCLGIDKLVLKLDKKQFIEMTQRCFVILN